MVDHVSRPELTNERITRMEMRTNKSMDGPDVKKPTAGFSCSQERGNDIKVKLHSFQGHKLPTTTQPQHRRHHYTCSS